MKKKKKKPSEHTPGKDPAIYGCFRTRIQVAGKNQLIGCEESTRIKAAFVWQGFLTKKGQPRQRLSWLEKLIVLLREATSEEGYNHEFWGAEISKPEWVRNMDAVSPHGWLHFPAKADDLSIRSIGQRLGYSLTLTERRMSLGCSDAQFRKDWQQSELEEARRGFPPEEAEKVRIAIPGYESFKEYAESVREHAARFRQMVMQFVEQQGADEAHEFREAFTAGAKKARGEDLKNPVSEFNRRTESFRILAEYWDSVSEFPNRGELCRFLAMHFPPRLRAKLEQAMSEKNSGTWKNFTEFVRDLCDEINLKLATRGRPRKNTGFRKR